MALQTTYQFLEPRTESNYRQLFVCGRSLRAETPLSGHHWSRALYTRRGCRRFRYPLPRSTRRSAYCLHEEELLRQEREAVLADMRARVRHPPYVPINGTPRA